MEDEVSHEVNEEEKVGFMKVPEEVKKGLENIMSKAFVKNN